jgi:hypothetical protein
MVPATYKSCPEGLISDIRLVVLDKEKHNCEVIHILRYKSIKQSLTLPYGVISHKHQCVYIHVPKTAGTSIEKKLGLFDQVTRDIQDHRTLAEIQPITLNDFKKPFSHATMYGIHRKIVALKERREFLTPKQYEQYFKFTLVRNPWARVFSWYKNAVADAEHQKTYRISPQCSFDQFVEEHLDDWPLKSQLYWLKDRSGEMPFDFIGRFENLREDSAKIFSYLGMDSDLPRLNLGNGESYQRFYSSESTKKVAEKYAEELELFGYLFHEPDFYKPIGKSMHLSLIKGLKLIQEGKVKTEHIK